MAIPKVVDQLATELAEQYGKFSSVEAVVLAGSYTNHAADDISDVDLYVYARDGLVSLQERRALINGRASESEMNNKFWETGDEWIEKRSLIHVDVMYRDVGWIIDEIQRVMTRSEASMGYSTAIVYNVLHSTIYYDRGGWFEELQKTAQQPYADELAYAVVQKNHPVLRKSFSSYKKQIIKALQREDYVNVQHRIAALVASYFDVLFAVNRMLHPGEKRLLDYAEAYCTKRPPNMRDEVIAVLYGDDPLQHIDELCDSLDDLLIAEGMITRRYP